jgi:hypothetical protein
MNTIKKYITTLFSSFTAWLKRQSLRRKIFYSIIIALLAFFIISKSKDTRIFEQVKIQNIQRTVVTSGKVVSTTDLSLSFDSSGVVRSVPVSIGDRVKKGQVLAYCGNSGRSPEPHLHFQIQTTPYIGSKTLAYPISYFYQSDGKEIKYQTFSTPQEGTFVANININKLLQQAFAFQPGYSIKFKEGNTIETWNVYTDAYNQTYIGCKENNAIAYFVNNETVFYFTNFYGSKESILYQFYLSIFKVVLSYMSETTIHDVLPLSVVQVPIIKLVQDFVAPFVQLIKPKYMLNYASIDDEHFTSEIKLETVIEIDAVGSKSVFRTSQVILSNGRLNQLVINQAGIERIFTCVE